MLPQQNNSSIWQSVPVKSYPPLASDQSADVCVVGGGLAGLLSAYLMCKNGFEVIVLERDSFANSETARSTGHLSFVLDEGFHHLIQSLGEDRARKAVASHSDAIDLIEKIIAEEKIDCEFRRVDGFLYLSPETDKDFLHKEILAASRLGIRDVELQASPLHFPDFGPALRYPRQARLHSVKFVSGLLQALDKMKCHLYSRSPAVEFIDSPLTSVSTENGHTVYAKNVFVCTNVPVNDRIRVHNLEAPYRSYVIGVEVPSGTFPDILMWDTEQPYHYLRLEPGFAPGKDLVLVGGEDHRVGQDDHPEDRFAALHDWLLFNVGISGPIEAKWSGQIIEPIDGLAHIGRNPGDRHTFIACGDSGHGITHAAITAMILRDLVRHTPNDWKNLYSPSRFQLRSLGRFIQNNMNALAQYRDRMQFRDELRTTSAPAGEGVLLHQGAKTFAVYTNEKNESVTLSAVCPHLGGIVHWNAAEKTWDCPCHGSRFACTGEVLNGPAVSGLKKIQPPVTPEVRNSATTEERIENEKGQTPGKSL